MMTHFQPASSHTSEHARVKQEEKLLNSPSKNRRRRQRSFRVLVANVFRHPSLFYTTKENVLRRQKREIP